MSWQFGRGLAILNRRDPPDYFGRIGPWVGRGPGGATTLPNEIEPKFSCLQPSFGSCFRGPQNTTSTSRVNPETELEQGRTNPGSVGGQEGDIPGRARVAAPSDEGLVVESVGMSPGTSSSKEDQHRASEALKDSPGKGEGFSPMDVMEPSSSKEDQFGG